MPIACQRVACVRMNSPKKTITDREAEMKRDKENGILEVEGVV